MVRLLDINLLLALCDPNHVHHRRAYAWFSAVGADAWASCPITQNGFIRILANPSYPGLGGSIALAISLLKKLQAHAGHEFWADDYSIISGPVDTRSMNGGKQVTDLYLLGLAVQHGSKFASLDRRIPANLVKDGASALEIL